MTEPIARRRPGGHEGDDAVAALPLDRAVAAVLAATRPGDVLTYGELAAEAGRPGAARAVGRVLSRSGGELAWWRVVTAGGRLVPGHEAEHARRLRLEGVAVERGRVVPAGRVPARGPGDGSGG